MMNIYKSETDCYDAKLLSGSKVIASDLVFRMLIILKCIVFLFSPTTEAAAVGILTTPPNATSISQGDTFARLPASPLCFANGFNYQHGQKISRGNNDPCIGCLCLYGSVYCRWDLRCHLTLNSMMGAPEENKPDSGKVVSRNSVPQNGMRSDLSQSTADVKWMKLQSHVNGDGFSSTEIGIKNAVTDSSSLASSSLSPICIVMGHEYYQGEVLPRETGTCLECRCGKEGRVTCSPKDCITQQDDEFHNPSSSNSLDMFDVDIF